MRVLQAAVTMKWFRNSPDPATSLFAYVCGAPATDLVDDAGFSTSVNPLEVTEIDSETGIVFYAKDAMTLSKGFKYLNAKLGNNTNLTLQSKGDQLAVTVITWNSGQVRSQSKAAAALLTIAHNAKALLTRTDYIQSVSENMAQVSRDGLLVQRGAAVFVHLAGHLPHNVFGGGRGPVRWYGTHMKGGTQATMADIDRLFNQVLRH
jgi:hypothetical protein